MNSQSKSQTSHPSHPIRIHNPACIDSNCKTPERTLFLSLYTFRRFFLKIFDIFSKKLNTTFAAGKDFLLFEIFQMKINENVKIHGENVILIPYEKKHVEK